MWLEDGILTNKCISFILQPPRTLHRHLEFGQACDSNMTMNEFQAGKNLLSGHILLGRVNSPSHEIFSNERRVHLTIAAYWISGKAAYNGFLVTGLARRESIHWWASPVGYFTVPTSK